MKRKHSLILVVILAAALGVAIAFFLTPTYYEIPPSGVGVFVSSDTNQWVPPQWPPPEGVEYRPMSYGEAQASGITPEAGVDISLRGPSRLAFLLFYDKNGTFPLTWNHTGIDALWKK